ncbi:type IV conjugative transfer system protein TraL [Legionella longbeachae]|uniref:type IV conjugative transfer system protein TraL n=1 Tax=Legionella longbeachae TaxID=450 RepID=UPI0009B7B4D1|nr:type IV conjugative transfer system protein TraL [Legionella longbeachae]VEE02710.1 putative sex pilus assembly protein-like protein [Legionella oakridgensis]ARB91027.1 type IV conjugative transfer system protein TraL [Legionella longbeachae]ARM32546.1 type IV conjugative transfer system protein TraL [Legionella longbeachae]RZV21182.1 type IV conjugative transfer system protein TraL [Legionella longbeachae]UAK45773.1 type IV conjugative transfer system protein TraL [Legionella longbeachae]
MDQAQKYKTPQYLNEPYRLILFTLDEVFVVVTILYFLGFVCELVITSMVMSCFVLFLMKRMKGNEGPSFYTHLFYWFFSIAPKLRATPPSWIREFLG